MKNGIKENGNSKKKFWFIVIGLASVCIILIILFLMVRDKKVSFERCDEKYFHYLANLYEEGDKIYSLDAYYSEETEKYYYELKYSTYIGSDGMDWIENDQVRVGDEAGFNTRFCLDWPAENLIYYQDEIGDLERAKKEGIHKSYTIDEIMKKIEEAKKNDN